ncbi:LPS export ABC transporter periplasmic protein LptC [Hymenobacter persicinus]|uniref:LPS export ABC transporter periplasmic protein LptC n=1 Tax=Hymenobacter persicinus TaxID=2025506 RepID=A0A4Q5LEA4_9BACT|nr:LPS export ABC transporter periplasmic protein LptC [Hymenobacter persicinus]RYU78733.1 LPS export ABC transporter periplasmic protein LptC [Hymenobacter persicinus]
MKLPSLFRCSSLLALVLAAGLNTGCEKKDAGSNKKVVYTGPTVEVTNVLTLVSDSAKLQVRLTAPLEQTFETGDQIYPKGVKVIFYGNGGRTIVNTLSGKYGKFEKNKNLYTVRGDVRVRNEEKQQKMNTEEVFYDKAKAQIYTKPEMFVKVETLTEILTGYGLTANQDFSRYRIMKPEGIFTVDQSKTTQP